VIALIDAHRATFGVEPICMALQFAPRTYHAAKARGPSLRDQRDAELEPEITRVYRENFGVYGADKVWAQLNREQIPVALHDRTSDARTQAPRGCAGQEAPHHDRRRPRGAAA
jgi:hypothetical protein